ncbi:orotidine 5'-phosphate decarboxylase [Candidatus Daviesbacteria bacterium RIFCSPLOWO2_02_FULL_36_7]|uniref:Orotidine-5'-phosphate decarboxylase n=1 Tax=Candidatus Daviesbacteria bacterium RIFCSPLOWO2_02_FULL_36_7 TaxID=1797792 RepID=A0A1F5MH22_9BACT|nr:MAG: orotidine 5'-phosphate decarboxylase [Candidatus Daviesbacteria bacterium RIFCSPLOWO2_02_FULL_36_7]
MSASFLDKLTTKWAEGKFVCVGLDSADFLLNQKVINATFDLVCAYKPNSAFYEAAGITGLETLKKTIQYIKEKSSEIPIILDAKRGDIGNTNEAYVKAIFDNLGVDAVTVHPYLGKEALQPFLDRTDKGIIVLVRTSNPGAGEFQDLEVDGKPLYQVVAEHVKTWGNNLGVVVGATYPEELKIIRGIIGDMPILVPGIGAQGGNLEETLKNGLNSKKQGLIINSSRGIIFAPDPREATLKLINQLKLFL